MSDFADLHIHSKYARATSRDCDAPHLDRSARRKGIALVGTGDFTHPGWRNELREMLLPAEDGLYALKDGYRLDANCADAGVARFVISGEISTIYKKNGKTRKVHSLILLPSLEAADALSLRLETIGNIRSDGRPILGLDCRDLLEITLDTCPEAVFIPAHIWTPHFSLFGAFSGFDTIEECFGDLAKEIHALETGLSSDPPMNRRVSALDRFTLVSNSDAHSPAKLGREVNVLDTTRDYPTLAHALQTGEGLLGTVEFFPEEGKYHLDGHRNCEVCLEPEETEKLGGRCPVCGRKLTVGVLHRVCQLADRQEGFCSQTDKPFESLMPLQELVASSLGISAEGKKAASLYERLLNELGTEFHILREASPEDVGRVAGVCVAEGLRRLRTGRVQKHGGYDGEYGKICVLTSEERKSILGQEALFGVFGLSHAEKQNVRVKAAAKAAAPCREQGSAAVETNAEVTLNAEQLCAVAADAPAIAVIAGPGTGKTKTLVARIAYLIESCGVRPEAITAVTFTNQAATEMRMRLGARLGGPQSIAGMTIGTFHAVCRHLLPSGTLLGGEEALSLLSGVMQELGSSLSPGKVQRMISERKNGVLRCECSEEENRLFDAYCARCRALQARDLDDLLLDALSLDCFDRQHFTHLLVDEFQDINALQRGLVRRWAEKSAGLFVIGDADQSIYGFRGASAACFDELKTDFPALRTIRLTKNYRSTPDILSAADAVIEKNPGEARLPVATRAAGLPVRLVKAEGPRAEAIWITKEIARMTGGVDMLAAHALATHAEDHIDGSPRPFSDMAVLCRTHRQLALMEECLRHDDIPCVVTGRSDALQSDDVRGALGFFRYLSNASAAPALFDCLRFTWKLSGAALDQACKAALLLGSTHADTTMDEESAIPKGFTADVSLFSPLMRKEKPARLLARFAAAHSVSDAFEHLIGFSASHADMRSFLNALTLGEEADLQRASSKRYASGAVRLSTLHGAKGLEFPVVFLAGLCAGTLPLERAGEIIDLAEERRLLFVGMTRAKDALILTVPGPSSIFEDDLPNTVRRENAPRLLRETRQMKLF